MVSLTNKLGVLSDGSMSAAPYTKRFYMHKDDIAIYGGSRIAAPCPAVWWVTENQMPVTKPWQLYLCAINYRMSLQYISAMLNNSKGYCNHQGFPTEDSDDGPRANYILNQDLSYPPPVFQKVFTNSFSTHWGVKEEQNSVGNWIVTFAHLDGTQSPPMKPGKLPPSTPEEAQARHDDYLYTPWTHRYMFFVPNNVALGGRVFPFDNGATYGYMQSSAMYTFMPFVSDKPVWDYLYNWVKLPLGSNYPYNYSL